MQNQSLDSILNAIKRTQKKYETNPKKKRPPPPPPPPPEDEESSSDDEYILDMYRPTCIDGRSTIEDVIPNLVCEPKNIKRVVSKIINHKSKLVYAAK